MTGTTGFRTILFSAAFAVALPAGAALAQDRGQQQGDRTPITGRQDQTRDEGRTVITGQNERGDRARTAGMQDRDDFEYDRGDTREIARNWYEERVQAYKFQKELDKLAAERTENPRIRQFAQHNLETAEREMERFREEMERVDVELESPEQLSRSQQARLEELRQLQGERFDRAYVFETHTNQFRIDLYDGYANRFRERELEGMRQTAERSRRSAMDRQQDYDAILIIFADPEERARTAGGRIEGRRGADDRDRTDRDRDDRRDRDRTDTGGDQ